MPSNHPVKNLPSVDYLRDCFTYDPATGELYWKHRPQKHFKGLLPLRDWLAWNKKFAGKIAGKISVGRMNGRHKYWLVCLDYKMYLAHRIAWKLTTGDEPPETIDHADHNSLNNRWTNLRPATRSEQQCNRPPPKHNTSGHKGVHLHHSRWRARISVNGIDYSLGVFDTAEEAAAAYKAAARKLHGKFFRNT
jgi:hypothetical protein